MEGLSDIPVICLNSLSLGPRKLMSESRKKLMSLYSPVGCRPLIHMIFPVMILKRVSYRSADFFSCTSRTFSHTQISGSLFHQQTPNSHIMYIFQTVIEYNLNKRRGVRRYTCDTKRIEENRYLTISNSRSVMAEKNKIPYLTSKRFRILDVNKSAHHSFFWIYLHKE